MVYNRLNSNFNSLENYILKVKDNDVVNMFNKVLKTKLNKYEFIGYLIIGLFIFSMFKFGCIEKSATGIYGGLLGSVVFYIGIQLYIKYISILKFIYSLQNISDYELYYHDMMQWLCKMY